MASPKISGWPRAGTRIISQAVKALAALGRGNCAIVSICADGGQGSVLLLEAA